MGSIARCNELSLCALLRHAYKSVTVHSWGSGKRPQQWVLYVHLPDIYWGCYTQFNILGKFHLVLPPWPSLTSILSATEMPDCSPYRSLNELSVPRDTAVLVCCFCLPEHSRSWTMGKIGVLSVALLHLPSEMCWTLNNPVILGIWYQMWMSLWTEYIELPSLPNGLYKQVKMLHF